MASQLQLGSLMLNGSLRNWVVSGVLAIIGLALVPVASAETARTTQGGAILTDVADITARLAHTDTEKRLNMEEYSVVRKYVLHNSRMSHDAVLTVRFHFHKGQGKSYEVLQSEGAEGLSRRVLDRLMDSEVEGARPGRLENSRLTPEHYDFALLGMDTLRGRPCYVLELLPKVKSKYLVRGKAWIDAADFAPVRVEGYSAANVSFWIGKPYIVQEFQKVGDFYMASYNRSKTDSHFLGDSVLTIEFSDYDVRTIEGTRVALQRCSAARADN